MRTAGLDLESRVRLIAALLDEQFSMIEVKSTFVRLFLEIHVNEHGDLDWRTRRPRRGAVGSPQTFHARRARSALTIGHDLFETELSILLTDQT